MTDKSKLTKEQIEAIKKLAEVKAQKAATGTIVKK